MMLGFCLPMSFLESKGTWHPLKLSFSLSLVLFLWVVWGVEEVEQGLGITIAFLFSLAFAVAFASHKKQLATPAGFMSVMSSVTIFTGGAWASAAARPNDVELVVAYTIWGSANLFVVLANLENQGGISSDEPVLLTQQNFPGDS